MCDQCAVRYWFVEGWLDQLQWQCSVVIRWMDRCSAGGAKQLHSIQLSRYLRYLRHIYNIYKDHCSYPYGDQK